MKFGTVLRKLIEEHGITQKSLAAKLNLAPSTLGSYVQNTREPDFELLKKIASYFQVTTDYLLELDNRKYIEVTGLTDIQLAHIQQIIKDITASSKK